MIGTTDVTVISPCNDRTEADIGLTPLDLEHRMQLDPVRLRYAHLAVYLVEEAYASDTYTCRRHRGLEKWRLRLNLVHRSWKRRGKRRRHGIVETRTKGYE